MNTNARQYLLGTIIVLLMLGVSLILRHHDFKDGTGARNLMATYHVLQTVNALNESPWPNHYFLPTITLGREMDKFVPWGATIPTKTSDYIYTSFTSISFILPNLWFKIFYLEPSVRTLAYFNVLLQTISVMITFLLITRLLIFNRYTVSMSIMGGLAGSTIGIFSHEALISHGVVYWAHSLYQPLLATSLYIFFNYLTTQKNHFVYSILLIILTFIGAYTEWTGYVFNAGLVLCLILIRQRIHTYLAIKIIFSTLCALIFTIIHYTLAIGFGPAIQALLIRFLSRSGVLYVSIDDLIQSYGYSYNLFIIILFIIIILAFFMSLKNKNNEDHTMITPLIFIASLFPLMENIILLQHATEFTFDRLKFIFPASLILAFSFARFNAIGKVILFICLLASSYYGFKSYKAELKLYASWGEIDKENKHFATTVSKNIDRDCTLFSANLKNSLYPPYIFHRNVYENMALDDALSITKARDGCATVYLEHIWAFPNSGLPKYLKATIIKQDGSKSVLYAKNVNQ